MSQIALAVSGRPAPRRVVVLRHGETVDNAAGVWQGHRNSALTPRGVEQARVAAGWVARFDPALVVSSDLERAAATAREVAVGCGIDPAAVVTDARLREVDVGVWSGMSGASVREEYAETFAAIRAGEDVRWGVTGERVSEVGERTGAALSDVVARLAPGGTAVVVCHGVAGRTAVAALLGLDQEFARQLLGHVRNGHWAEMLETPGGAGRSGWVLQAWNVGALA